MKTLSYLLFLVCFMCLGISFWPAVALVWFLRLEAKTGVDNLPKRHTGNSDE